ncbi:armadillo-type protein [Suillus americanus]|nr:armadillo-type protein [Suillus americanus]
MSESSQDSDLDEEVEDEDQSTSAEDQSDGSWEDEEWGGFDGLSKNDGSEAGGNDDVVDDDDHEMTETKENEPSDAQPKAAGRYIPPGLRKQANSDTNETEEQLKLTRQLKGLINRMSEQNIATILDSIEDVYRNHRRHDVTSTLTNLIIDGISSHSTLLDSYVVLHAAFISSLHKLIGTAFAAYFVQNVVSSYEQHLASVEGKSAKSTEVPEDLGKECSNLIVLLSELYNFQVISCILIYDIIRGLLDKNLSEFRVELLLKLLRSSGQQLRQDDPMALKDIVNLAQSRATGEANTMSSRTRFMTETLNNLKNNKIKKTAATQHQGGDAVERMKKFLSGLGKKKHVLAHDPLRVSLEDLHSAESKGKWWLIGAAWGGDPLADQSREVPQHGGEPETDDVSTAALLKLARKQGMNTDIRRSIFVVLMSSDDYLDACERLAQLGLTEVQQREIIRVNLHCCGNEKSYNPYYTLVCQHLSQRSHSYKITLQFCLWDFLRDLGESSVGGLEVIKSLKDNDVGFDVKSMSPSRMKNVAKAYAWWIAKDCCTLTIFKPVDFTMLKPQTRTFLKELFIQLFIASQVSSPMLSNESGDYPSMRNRGSLEEIFLKASRIENLGLGLVFFMSNTFKGEDVFSTWASSVAKETLQTGMDHIPRI